MLGTNGSPIPKLYSNGLSFFDKDAFDGRVNANLTTTGCYSSRNLLGNHARTTSWIICTSTITKIQKRMDEKGCLFRSTSVIYKEVLQ